MFIKLNDIDIKVIDNVNISVNISVNINVNVISQWASSLVSLLFVNSCGTASDNITQRVLLDIFTNEKT